MPKHPDIAKYEPKTMIASIYKIEHKSDSGGHPIYVGSTRDLYMRAANHKHCCNKEGKKHHYRLYQYIRQHGGGWAKWHVVELVILMVSGNQELHRVEKYFVDCLKPKLNANTPSRTMKGWKKDNPEKVSKINLMARLRNRESINARMRQYYHQHTDELKVKRRQYYTKNKEQIRKQRIAKCRCLCGAVCARHSLRKHLKSPGHATCMKVVQAKLMDATKDLKPPHRQELIVSS